MAMAPRTDLHFIATLSATGQHSGDCVKQGCFARAVRTDNTENLACVDVEGDIRECCLIRISTSATGNIQHTVRYTELSPGRFKDFWR
jgi:hypothetical protein